MFDADRDPDVDDEFVVYLVDELHIDERPVDVGLLVDEQQLIVVDHVVHAGVHLNDFLNHFVVNLLVNLLNDLIDDHHHDAPRVRGVPLHDGSARGPVRAHQRSHRRHRKRLGSLSLNMRIVLRKPGKGLHG
jgi:hypothetical protein